MALTRWVSLKELRKFEHLKSKAGIYLFPKERLQHCSWYYLPWQHIILWPIMAIVDAIFLCAIHALNGSAETLEVFLQMHTTCKGCATIHDASGLVCTPLKKVISNAACLIATKIASTPTNSTRWLLCLGEHGTCEPWFQTDHLQTGFYLVKLANNLPAGPIIEHMKS